MVDPEGVPLTPELQKANRYHLAMRDCEDAKRYLEACRELADNDEERGTSEHWDHREGLLLAAIVAYSRPFMRSYSDGFADNWVQVDADEVLGDAELAALHKLILERRKQAVAHSDWTYHQTQLVQAQRPGGVSRRHPMVNYWRGISIEQFLALLDRMRQHFLATFYNLDMEEAVEVGQTPAD